MTRFVLVGGDRDGEIHDIPVSRYATHVQVPEPLPKISWKPWKASASTSPVTMKVISYRVCEMHNDTEGWHVTFAYLESELTRDEALARVLKWCGHR